MQYKTKAVQTGTEIEVTQYSKAIRRGVVKRSRRNLNDGKMRPEMSEDERREKRDASLKNSLSRAKTNLRQLINTNIDCDKFLTLTFAEHITDLENANNLFGKFIKRLNYRFDNIKYIASSELTKIGRVHYHVILKLPFVDAKEMAKIWGHGFIKINRIDKIKNMGAYLSKYLTKEHFNEKNKGKKKYYYSKNCTRPKEHYGIYAEALHDKVKMLADPVYKMTFKKNKYVGMPEYSVFDISKLQDEFFPKT